MKKNLNTKQIVDVGPNDIGSGENILSITKKNGFLAIGGENGNVIIKNKLNQDVNYKKFENPIKYLEWDKDDEFLIILLKDSKIIYLWEPFSPQQNEWLTFEFASNEFPTFAKWANKHPIIAIGSNKGSILFYNRKTQKKIPTVAKHSKSIISGDWSAEDLLITSSEDKSITISKHTSEISDLTNEKGKNINVEYLKIRWTYLLNENNTKDLIYIALLKEQKIITINYPNLNKYPTKISFSNAYGNVWDFELYEDNQIVISFSRGKLVFYSLHNGEQNNEIATIKPFSGTINKISICKNSNRLAIAGEGKIKIFNTKTYSENKKENIIIPPESGKVINLGWGLNGNILFISTINGYGYGILVGSPSLYSYDNNLFSFSTSFNEISIFQNNELINILKIDFELNQIILKMDKIFILSNNIIYCYSTENISKKDLEFIEKYEYDTHIYYFEVNSREEFLILSNNGCFVDMYNKEDSKKIEFPKYNDDKKVCKAFLKEYFLITLDEENKINIYSTENYEKIINHKWDTKIDFIEPNVNGNKIFLETNGKGYIWLCSRAHIIEIKNYTPRIEKIIWDNVESNTFISLNGEIIETYIINQNYWEKPITEKVMEITDINEIDSPDNEPSETIIEKDMIIIALNSGKIKCLKKGYFEIFEEELTSHKFDIYLKSRNKDENTCLTYIYRNIALYNFKNCIKPMFILNYNELFEILGKLAMESLDFETSIIYYNRVNNISLVTSINSLKKSQDINFLKAGVAIILNKFDIAYDIYLKKKLYKEAFNLMVDIHSWDKALNLAENHFPDNIQYIKKKLAYSFEIKNDYIQAINYYTQAQMENYNSEEKTKIQLKKIENHNDQCKLGIARNLINSGNLIKGFDITWSMNKNENILEIADLLFSNKSYNESAKLYEKLKKYDDAINCYLFENDILKCKSLIKHITNKFYLSKYAEKLEKKLEHKEALIYYEKAEEWLASIKINLNIYNNLERAKELFKKSPSENIALIIAEYSSKNNNNEEAIKFLILAGKNSLAFTKAFSNNLIDVYCENLEEFNEKEAFKIAQFYEGNEEYGKAAKFYELSFNYNNSFDCFIKSNDDTYLNDLIEMVNNSQLEELFEKTLDFLSGENTGQPKDPIYLFKLYLKFGKEEQYLRIASAIIDKELDEENYAESHKLIYNFYKDLKENNCKFNFELYNKMVILHSYIIVKPWVKLQNNKTAARLLDRIAKHISFFPKKEVNILTFTIIQSSKAGFKKLAYKWAINIIKPEYKDLIDPNLKGRIEKIALKPIREGVKQEQTACPFCRTSLNEFELNCDKCGNNIPFCIASGKHMTENDCTSCPNCKFPALKSEFEILIKNGNNCTMCDYNIKINELKLVENPKSYLKERILEKL